MDPSKLRKRQIARRLGVSEQILEQYLQLKRAEVLQPKQEAGASSSSGGVHVAPAVSGQATPASARESEAAHPRPSRGSRPFQRVSGGRSRGPRGS